ncbi:hypothetical protein FRB99_008136 [Tulasnella sp. 403]|nr:hypothetical protein FRB99_008136 [Tulasnella sp. 403]
MATTYHPQVQPMDLLNMNKNDTHLHMALVVALYKNKPATLSVSGMGHTSEGHAFMTYKPSLEYVEFLKKQFAESAPIDCNAKTLEELRARISGLEEELKSTREALEQSKKELSATTVRGRKRTRTTTTENKENEGPHEARPRKKAANKADGDEIVVKRRRQATSQKAKAPEAVASKKATEVPVIPSAQGDALVDTTDLRQVSLDMLSGYLPPDIIRSLRQLCGLGPETVAPSSDATEVSTPRVQNSEEHTEGALGALGELLQNLLDRLSLSIGVQDPETNTLHLTHEAGALLEALNILMVPLLENFGISYGASPTSSMSSPGVEENPVIRSLCTAFVHPLVSTFMACCVFFQTTNFRLHQASNLVTGAEAGSTTCEAYDFRPSLLNLLNTILAWPSLLPPCTVWNMAEYASLTLTAELEHLAYSDSRSLPTALSRVFLEQEAANQEAILQLSHKDTVTFLSASMSTAFTLLVKSANGEGLFDAAREKIGTAIADVVYSESGYPSSDFKGSPEIDSVLDEQENAAILASIWLLWPDMLS